MPAYDYDDIALIPQYFKGTSRSQLNTSVRVGDHWFKLPVIPANMKCVIDVDSARTLQSNGYFYVMHRFDIDSVSFVEQCYNEKWNTCSISVGVKERDRQVIVSLANKKLSPHFITVDIAHGHCSAMRDMLKHIKQHLPKTFIIAGNIATTSAYEDLQSWGANAIKCGIGPGKSCTTKLKTGFFTPMFTSIKFIRSNARIQNTLLIADGGIQHNGDIAKAMVAGADLVMIGSMFAQCVDSPAVSINGEKVYYGSASAENKSIQKNIEGRKLLIESNGMTYLQKMQEITEDLQSSISYAGGSLSIDTPYMVLT